VCVCVGVSVGVTVIHTLLFGDDCGSIEFDKEDDMVVYESL
jgi:hypothetical protein